jgi:DNA invertase Pin-like site-specific DNA recombinase
LQKDALEKIGCTKIYSDVVSGSKAERKGLQEALEYVREGDTLVIWRLDRLGRSLKHLIEIITKLNNRKVGFQSITENIDTTTSGGKLVFHIFGALAEFERDIIKDRTKAGLSAARARGRLGGRPKAKMLDTPKKVALAQSLYENRNNTIDEICKTLNVSRATLYRYIKAKATP